MSDVRAGRGGPVPPHLRDAHYPGSRGLGHGRGYRYPHDDPRGVVRQQYVPDDLVGTDYYRPTDHGAERAVGERVPRLRRIVRGLGPTTRTPANGPVTASVSTADRAAGGARATDESSSSADSSPGDPAADAGDVSGISAPVGSARLGSASEAGADSAAGAEEGSALDAGTASVAEAGTGSAADAGIGSVVEAGTGSVVEAGTGSAVVAGTASAAGAGAGSAAEAGSGDGAAVVAGSGPVAGGVRSSDDSGDSAGEEQR
jgi:putative ATPase